MVVVGEADGVAEVGEGSAVVVVVVSDAAEVATVGVVGVAGAEVGAGSEEVARGRRMREEGWEEGERRREGRGGEGRKEQRSAASSLERYLSVSLVQTRTDLSLYPLHRMNGKRGRKSGCSAGSDRLRFPSSAHTSWRSFPPLSSSSSLTTLQSLSFSLPHSYAPTPHRKEKKQRRTHPLFRRKKERKEESGVVSGQRKTGVEEGGG